MLPCILFVENSFQIVGTICFHRHLRRNMNIHFQISNPSRGRKTRLVVFGATWGFGCAVVGRLLTKESGIFLHDANPRFWILSFGKVPLEFICSHVPTYIYIYSDSYLDIIWLLFKLKLLTRATNDHDSNHFPMALVHSELLCSQKAQSFSQLIQTCFNPFSTVELLYQICLFLILPQ